VTGVEVLRAKSILVTGATGFIGRHLVTRLASVEGAKVLALARSIDGGSRPPHWEEAGVVAIPCALENLSPRTWAESGISRIDLVVHLGSHTPKAQAEADDFEPLERTNIRGTRRLLESLPGPPSKVVFASTLDVYKPPDDGQPITEATPLGPVTLYAASKLFSEAQVRLFARSRGIGDAILRYGHIYGPGEGAYRKLIPETIKRVLADAPPTLRGSGEELRDFLYVDDAVEATVRALLSPAPSLGPLNIVHGESVRVVDLLDMVLAASGKNLPVIREETQRNGRSFRFDNKAMREALGAWTLVTLEDGLRRELEAFKESRGERVP
jgi:nucleoside-diphosphate-sugar epimerase